MDMSGQMPLTARALDQLDAQVAHGDAAAAAAAAEKRGNNKHMHAVVSTITPDLPKIREFNGKTRPNLKSENSKGKTRLPSADWGPLFF